jgi:hypothetical protein
VNCALVRRPRFVWNRLVSSGWIIGRRLRGIIKGIDAYTDTKLRAEWNSAGWMARLGLLFGVATCGYFLVVPPAPGVGIAVLGAVAGFMSLIHMSHREKTAWTLIIFCLLWIELKAISRDRNEHDRKEREARSEEVRHSQLIANGINTTVAKGQQQFDTTMKSVQKIIASESESLKSITGGDSFCYLMPYPISDRDAIGVLIHSGKYPIYDLSLRIVDLHLFKQSVARGSALAALGMDYNLGNLAPHAAEPNSNIHLALTEEAPDFNLFFSARNGFWEESLRLRRVNGNLSQAILVERQDQSGSLVRLFEDIDRDFPRGALASDEHW